MMFELDDNFSDIEEDFENTFNPATFNKNTTQRENETISKTDTERKELPQTNNKNIPSQYEDNFKYDMDDDISFLSTCINDIYDDDFDSDFNGPNEKTIPLTSIGNSMCGSSNTSSPILSSNKQAKTSSSIYNPICGPSALSSPIQLLPKESPQLPRNMNQNSTPHSHSLTSSSTTTSTKRQFKTPSSSSANSSHKLKQSFPFLNSFASPILKCSSKSTVKKRKFPGPAGLLPQLPSGNNFENLLSPDIVQIKSPKNIQIPCSQSFEDEFEKSAWKTMIKELNIDENDPNNILNRFNIDWIATQAAMKQLPNGKAPVLCAFIKSLSPFGYEAGVTLYDKSGEMSGSLHCKLMEEYALHLQVGTVLVLQQVSVFSPNVRKHYLNVTPNNLVGLYTEENCFKAENITATLLARQADESLYKAKASKVPKNTYKKNQTSHSNAPSYLSTSHSSIQTTNHKTNSNNFKDKPTNVNQSNQSLSNKSKENQGLDSFFDDDMDDLLMDIDEDELFGNFI